MGGGRKFLYIGAVVLIIVVAYAYFIKRREGFRTNYNDFTEKSVFLKDGGLYDQFKQNTLCGNSPNVEYITDPTTKKEYAFKVTCNNIKYFGNSSGLQTVNYDISCGTKSTWSAAVKTFCCEKKGNITRNICTILTKEPACITNPDNKDKCCVVKNNKVIQRSYSSTQGRCLETKDVALGYGAK